jgi:hypothetical protein
MIFILKSNTESLFFPEQVNDFLPDARFALVDCGVFTEKKLKAPYHVTVIFDGMEKIRLASFIMPAGNDCYNFTLPHFIENIIRGDATQCKIELQFEPLMPNQAKPRVNFAYANIKLNKSVTGLKRRRIEN